MNHIERTDEMNKEQPLKVEVIDDRLVISIGIAVLAEAAEQCPDLEDCDDDGNFKSPAVTDQAAFAKAVVIALEEEDGGRNALTPVQKMLDAVFLSAIESGADGVKLPSDA